MKLRKWLTALLLAAGLLCVFGCGGKKSGGKSDDKKAGSPSAVVREFTAAIKKADFDTVAKLCHGELKENMEEYAEAQEKVITSLEKAAQDGNEKAEKLLEKCEQYGYIEILKAGAEDGVEECQKALKVVRNFDVEIKGETIDGDLAVVDVVVSGTPDGEDGPDKVYLKKVGGEWKIISDDDYAREKAK